MNLSLRIRKMLKKLFGSGSRVKILKQFFTYPEDEFFIRELTRLLDEQINSMRRELDNLETIGLLKSNDRNRKKYYRLNPHFPLYHELYSIVRKTQDANDDFLKKVSKLGNVDLLVLMGIFVEKQKDTDIFIVGDISKEELQGFLDEQFPDQSIKFSLMKKEDFLYRMTLNDKFIKDVFSDKDNIVLKNKMKKDTLPLISKLIIY